MTIICIIGRSYKLISWIGYISIPLYILKVFALLPYAYVTYENNFKNATSAQPFSAPGGDWSTWFLALATFPFGYSPFNFIIELSHDCKKYDDARHAMIAAGKKF